MTTIEWSMLSEDAVKIYDINWTVVNVKQLTEDGTREIHSDIIDGLFELKIKFVGMERQYTEFYYSSRNPMLLLNGQINVRSSFIVHGKREHYATLINMWTYMSSYEGDYLSEVQRDDKAELKIQLKLSEVDLNYRELATSASLNADIGNILNSEMFSDVTIKSVEGKEYKAYRSVLTRSAVLMAQLEHNSAECRPDIIETELESTVLEQVLMFLNTDAVPTVDENPEKLLAAADNYRLTRLKRLCELSLQKKVTISNAIDTLSLACKYSAEELKQSTLKYIIYGRASLVTKTEGWAKLDSLELAKMIHEYYVMHGNPEPCSHRMVFAAEMGATTTEGCVKTYNFSWAVPNIKQLLGDDTTREIHSEVIDSIIQLKIRLPGREKIIEFYYMITYPVYSLNCELSIPINHYLKRFIRKRDRILYYLHDGGFKSKKMCTTPKINTWYYLGWLSRSKMNLYTYYSTIRQNFKVQITNMPVEYCNANYKVGTNADCENTLNSEIFSDTLMKSTDGDEYRVHKVVLAARSSVLKACFEHNTSECHTNTIESPFDSEVLKEVLTFIYTDAAPRVNEIPERILVAADYYQLGRLKSFCELALQRQLTIDNAIDTLQFAMKYSAHALKESTWNVIKDDLEALITKTDGWTQLNSVECVKIIHENVVASRVEWEIQRYQTQLTFR